MKYIANSFKNFILQEVTEQMSSMGLGGKMIFMIESIPEDLILTTADLIESSLQEDEAVNVVIKIAKTLTDKWSEAGKRKVKPDWLTEKDNLAYYRNLPVPADKYNVILLYGSDVVTDSASLADFKHCSLKLVWENLMNRSFKSWIKEKLEDNGISIYGNAEMDKYDNILCPIIDHGRADLISISSWLEHLEIAYCEDSSEVLRLILTQLRGFKLPNFNSFSYDKKNKKFSDYVYKAIDFFSYTMFLEDRKKNSAVKAIDGILDVMQGENTKLQALEDVAVRGAYNSGEEFLQGMRKYVLTEDEEERNKLIQSDFVYILDKILKYKTPKQKRSKSSTRKLEGSAVEVVLTAIWDSLCELSKSKDSSSVGNITKIEITGERFKHDMEWDDDQMSYSTQEVSEAAAQYLAKFLGGLDNFIKSHTSVKNKDSAEVKIVSELYNGAISYSYSSTAISQLEFCVKLYALEDDSLQERKYAWKLPTNHSYRLATELINMVADELERADQASVLPFFHLPYYDEILRTVDNDELRRVFQHSIRDSASGNTFMKNMLSPSWLKYEDALLNPYRELAEKYHQFIRSARENGLIATLSDTSIWEPLRLKYEQVLELINKDEDMLNSPMAGMVLRAFMVIREREEDESDRWYGNAFEKSCIITVLHPSLLEMLQAQMVYQSSCFNYAVKAGMAKDGSQGVFERQTWRSYLDLAHIRNPINCILVDDGLNLNTNVMGHELIHKVGEPYDLESLKSTKLLLGLNDGSDDDIGEISDTDMFLETRESKLLFTLLKDYFLLHPHVRDGISLAVYRNQDIQPIIAAIHAYLKKLSSPKKEDKDFYVIKPGFNKHYNIRVTIFSDSADDSGIARWVEQYAEIWEAAETEDKYRMYRNCKFSISHRVFNSADQKSFLKMISNNYSADVTVLYNIVGSGIFADKFESVDPIDIRTHTLKYPILEKAMATLDNPADRFKRFRIISNRQFGISSKLAECMHAMKNRQLQKGTVVMGTGDLRPWMNVLDKIHEKSQWVVCIDQSVDDRLIRDSSSGDSSKKREIIGFGTGVGVSGEENYTISTEHHSLSDIELKLRESIKQRIRDPKWTEEDYKSVSERIMRVASNISGLSLVRATGVVDEHIRDLMAYSLTRKLVGRDNTLLCDELITLDAYSHWFGFAESMKKPDILWLKADVESDHRLRLDLHLIECKMSEDPKPMMKKAREQVDNGLKVLVDAFKPIDRNAKELDDDKPDRRYWWMQLHRLIAARAKIDKAGDMSKVISALEKLAEGDYEISWEASVMAFWTEAEFDNIFKAGCWENDNLCSGKANVYSIGVNHIRSIAQSNDDGMLKELTDAPLEDEDNIMPIAEELDLIEDLDDEEYRAESPAAEMDDDEYIDDEDEIDSVPSFGVDISSEIQQPEITEDVAISVGFPQRILLGKADTGKDVYWEFGHKDLANRHMVIFGTSGMGKTYAIQCILCELARQNQNSLVIDYTDGFTPSNIEPAAKHFITDAAQEYIYNEPLPINPFKAQVSEEGGQKFNDKPLTIAKRVSSIFKNVYELGTQQLPLTIEVIEKGVDKYGDDFNLEKMLDMLHGYLDHELYTKNTVSTTITKLRPFISSRPFLVDKSEYGWHELFADSVNRCRIFQFHKVDKHSSRAIIEFVLWDLYNYVSSYGGKDKPKVIVLDEIQNLALDEDAPVAKYLTEGRKHGLCLITATQTVKGVGGVSDAKVSRLFQAETKLFFKPTENEMREHAQLLHNAIGSIPVAEWRNRLAKLKKGECWILGRHLVERTGELKLMANKVRISSLEERGFGV